MKKLLFLCIICLGATTHTNAQMRDTTVNMNTYKVDANTLLQKSQKQKTTSFILLGGGACIAALAYIIASADPIGTVTDEKKSTNLGVLLASGGAVMLSSIPFFIASGKNKRKANLMLKDEAVFFNQELNKNEHLIAVGIKINW